MRLRCVWLAASLLTAGTAGSRCQEPLPPAATQESQQKPGQPPQPEPPQPQPPQPELKPLPEEPGVPVAGDSLFAPLAVGSRPESAKIKFDSYLVVTFGPRAVVAPIIPAAFRMAFPNYKYPNDWHQGMQGFGRQYGSAFGTKAALETGRFGVGLLLHEDFRYRPSQSHGFFPRLGHAVAFTIVDRSDSDTHRLALANFAGALAGGFVPILWLPEGFNTPKDGGRRSAIKLGNFAIQNVTREFSPEIAKVFAFLHLPFPRLPVPPWWTKDFVVARP